MKQGFSLLEVILSCSLLMLASAVIFSVFCYGQRGFSLASGRNSIQCDARSTFARLRQDLEQSAWSGVSLDTGVLRRATVPLSTGPSVQPRDLICMASLTDWYASGNFDPVTGLPLWNSYVLYHPDLQTNQSKLYRVELVVPAFSGGGWSDFTTYFTGYLGTPPAVGTNISGAVVRSRRVLAGSLLGFEISKSTKSILVTLRLWNRAKGVVQGSKDKDEILEIRSRIAPNNLAY